MRRHGGSVQFGAAARRDGGLRNLAGKFASYIAIGAGAFVADYCVFLLVLNGTGNPYLANFFGICTGITVSFSLNSKFTFQKTDLLVARSARFVLVALGGLALSSLIIAVLMAYGVDPRFAKVAAMIVVFGMQFAANALWTFR